jgi:hypothetical protein
MAVGKRKRKSLLEFAGTWEGKDIDEGFDRIKKEREQSAPRRTKM